jgi:uncharacterized membrane protein
MIQVKYQLTLDDYREANKAFAKSRPAQFLLNWFLGIILVLMGTFLLASSFLLPRDTGDNSFLVALLCSMVCFSLRP